MKKTHRETRLTPEFIFIILLGAGALLSSLSIWLSGGETIRTLFFHDQTDTFMDFFHCLVYSADPNPYQADSGIAIYPPLAYVIFGIIGKGLSPDQLQTLGGRDLRMTQTGMMLFLLFAVLCTLVICALLQSFLSRGEPLKGWLLVLLIGPLSAPFIYLMERGNILIVSLLFLLAFVAGKDHKQAIVRELALICLALSAALKLYPAIFGLTLIIEKRYKEALRCVIYGAAAFVLPFFFYGGLPAIRTFIKSLTDAVDTTSFHLTGVGYRIDFSNTMAILSMLFLNNPVPDVSAAAVVTPLLSILLLVCAFLFDDSYKRILSITLVMVIFPSFNYYYSAVFYCVPAILLAGCGKKRRLDCCYAVLLSGMLVIPAFGQQNFFPWLETNYPMTLSVLNGNIFQIALIILILFDAVYTLTHMKPGELIGRFNPRVKA